MPADKPLKVVLVNGVLLLPKYQVKLPLLHEPLNVAVSPSQMEAVVPPFTLISTGTLGFSLTVKLTLALLTLSQPANIQLAVYV